jgi:hypothetical protein
MSVETEKYLRGVARMIRAAGKRVGDADEAELVQLVGLRDVLEEAIGSAVQGQRSIGRSWAYVGRVMGMSRQAAAQRWGRREAA